MLQDTSDHKDISFHESGCKIWNGAGQCTCDKGTTSRRIVPGAESVVLSNTLDKKDVVKNPSHYQFFPDVEAIEIIAMSMTEEAFRGYCLGNRLKYRLRAGKKDDPRQELDKSDFYIELFNRHRRQCRPPIGCKW